MNHAALHPWHIVFDLRPMTVADIPDALRLWQGMTGISLFASDSVDGITRYLNRNPGLSVICRHEGKIVGAAMGGHDGRRGYLHHVAVSADCRLRGIGRAMVEWCVQRIDDQGIGRCHILVNADNEEGLAFWKHLGWDLRPQVHLMAMTLDESRA